LIIILKQVSRCVAKVAEASGAWCCGDTIMLW